MIGISHDWDDVRPGDLIEISRSWSGIRLLCIYLGRFSWAGLGLRSHVVRIRLYVSWSNRPEIPCGCYNDNWHGMTMRIVNRVSQ